MSNIVTHLGQNFKWTAYKNGHNRFTITFTSGGSAFNISSYVFVVNIRTIGGDTNKLQLTESSGITNGGATGILTIDLTKTQASTTLPRDMYFYEIVYTASSKEYPLIQGNLSLETESNPDSASTSVSMSVSLAGSAVSAAVTLGMSGSAVLSALGAQTATHFLGGPTPSFRAIAAADLPVDFSISATAPATSLIWLDSASAANQAYPIRHYINGAWTPVTDECDWWDTIGGVISKGKPIAILFSGQSNVGTAAYFPSGEPTYTGDVTVSKYVTLWQPTSNEFKVFDYADAATRGNRTWDYPLGQSTDDLWGAVGANQLWMFGKLYAKTFNRSIRFVGTRRGGQPLAQWEATKSAWTELVAIATESGIGKFDAFVWIHGEAELSDANNPTGFSTYKDSFYDFIDRLKDEAWADEKIKVIAPSHALNDATAFTGAHGQSYLSPNGDVAAEGTIRSLDNQDSPYYAWAAIFYAREAQQGATDPYHFTTREHERIGAAIYSTYLQLPNYRKGDRLYRTFYTNSSNRLTAVRAVIPNTNDFEIQHSGGNSQTAEFKRSFSTTGGVGYIADIQELIKGISANNVSWEIKSSTTTPGTLETKIKVDYTGVTIPKLLHLTGSNTIGSDPVGGIVFQNGGGTSDDVWIASDASKRVIVYKSGQSGQAEGGHKFYLGEVLSGQFYWRTLSDFQSRTFELTSTDFRIATAGKGLYIKEGTNATMGVATLVAGTVTVSNTKVTASSRIFLTIQSLGTVTTPKAIGITARTAGTSFTITSADATDTSVIAWQIVEGF